MSRIRKIFENHIPIWVTRLPMVEEDWNALLLLPNWHPGSVRAVAFSPDSQLVASASENMVLLWGPGIGSSLSRLAGHLDLVRAVAFSPDGQLVVSASEDKTIRLWDADTGSCCHSTLEEHSSVVRSIAFSPDRTYLITDRGPIPIPLSRCSTPYGQVKEQFAISVDGMWIAANDQHFLWLPVDYRPRCAAVCGSLICLGRASGHLTFLEFDFESMSI